MRTYCIAQGFPGSSVVKNLPANAGDTRDVRSIPGLGRSPGVGNGNLLQDSCLENSMDRAAWQATVHGVTNASEMTERSYSNLAKKKINHDQMASTPQRNVNSTWGF